MTNALYLTWDYVFMGILLICLVAGLIMGFIRTLSLLSAHLFSAVLSLVFAPSVGNWVTGLLKLSVGSHFPAFVILYLIPMVLFTQLFRSVYKRNNHEKPIVSGAERFGGFFMGTLLGAFFSFLLCWVLILQPFVPIETIHSWGGTLFSQATRLLQFFMRFYV